MDGDFSEEQKKVIGNYIIFQLKRHGLTQASVARSRGCSVPAVGTVVWQREPLHVKMAGLKNFVAKKAGYSSWEELCCEALANETQEVV